MRYNTRVVALVYDQKEYKDDVKELRAAAREMACRYNLRIGITTDTKVIKDLKLTHPEFFSDYGYSVLVLRRYDGAIFKVSLSEILPSDYIKWISDKSSMPVEELKPAVL